MRLTLTATLLLGGLALSGCESLNKTARWPGKTPAGADQLANDSQRREAAAQQSEQQFFQQANHKPLQQSPIAQTNFTPGTEVDGMLLRAKQAEEAQQLQVAGGLYEQVLQRDPQNSEAHHRLGVLCDQAGLYQDAQQHYQLALQQSPQNASLLSDIGYSYYSQDRLDDAEQYLTASLQIQPQNQYARNNLAHVYGRRAQQTGSPADYKLAHEQFAMALGPQGADQQMKQFFPQGSSQDHASGLANPFKKSEKTVAGKLGSKLQAPNPKTDGTKDGTEKFLKHLEQTRLDMEARGELPPRKGRNPNDRSFGARGNGNAAGSIPLDRVNAELSRIDSEAARQQGAALRQSADLAQRGGNFNKRPDLNRPGIGRQGEIEQVAGWNDPQAPALPPMDRNPRNTGNTQWEDRMNPRTQEEYANRFQNDWDSTVNGGSQFNSRGGTPEGNSFQQQPPGDRGASWNGGNGIGNNLPPHGLSNQDAPPSFSEQSWPTRESASTPGGSGPDWDGMPIINDTINGRDSNSNLIANDPTYRTGNGQPFGPQRPAGTNRTLNGGDSLRTAAGWDEGRQTAAQLGLDSGMGEMFPSGSDQAPFGSDPRLPATGRRNSPPSRQGSFGSDDPSMMPISTTPGGMQPGGNGMVSPADYNQSAPDFDNRNYSRGIQPTRGDNYGATGDDVAAPWNQSATQPRNTRGTPNSQSPQYQQSQWGSDAGASQGRFAPSGQYNTAPRNFGAPPMYYGR